MATSYPTSIDSFTDPVGTNPTTNPDHAAQHSNANDAINAIETYLGTSAAPGSALDKATSLRPTTGGSITGISSTEIRAEIDGNSGTEFSIRNSNAGTAANPMFVVENDLGAHATYGLTSSGFTPSGTLLADQMVLATGGAGGMVLESTTGDIVFTLGGYVGSQESARFQNSTGVLNNRKGYRTNVIQAGALPTASLSSGVAAQLSTIRDVFTRIPVTLNPSASNTATVAVALSPDNSTFTTTDTITIPSNANAWAGQIQTVALLLPAGWWIRLTAVNATIGTATYY